MSKIQYNFKASEEFVNMIKLKAKSANISVSELIRQSINKTEINYNDSKVRSQLISEMNWIGNNINQIAKVLNTANYYKTLDDIDFEELKVTLLDISESIKSISEKHK